MITLPDRVFCNFVVRIGRRRGNVSPFGGWSRFRLAALEAGGAASFLLLLADRHRNSGDLHLDRAEVVAAGEIERLPVVAAKGDVGRRRRAVDDAAELLS